jgi:hypothetical protein
LKTRFHSSELDLFLDFALISAVIRGIIVAIPEQEKLALLVSSDGNTQPGNVGKNISREVYRKGLHQKVIERLITFLRYHYNEIEIGFLAKQTQIITTVVTHYFDNVPNQTGVEFYKAVEERKKDIEKTIAKEQKPKVRNKAAIAFSLLYETVTNLINKLVKKVA